MNLLLKKDFRRLMIGKGSSLLGSNMQQFALSLYVLSITGSAVIFSTMIAISTIPRILFSPIAGVFGDWFDRKKTIVRLDLLNSLLIGCFAIYYYLNDGMNIFSIYLLVFILEVIEIFFGSAMGAVIPSIIKKDNLLEANSINSIIDSGSNITAPIIASSVYALFGLQLILIVNSISFLLSALLEMTIDIPKYNKEPEKVNFYNFKTDFKAGLSILKQHKILINVIAFGVFLNFSLGPLLSVGLIFLFFDVLNSTEIQYGIVTAVIGVGMLCAPIFLGKKAKNIEIGHLLINIFFIVSFIVLLLAFTTSNLFLSAFNTNLIPMIIIGIIVFLIVILVTIVNISFGTLFQTLVPREFLGRVGSVMNIGLLTSVPLGQIVFGILIDYLSISIAITLLGVLILAATLYFRKPFIDNKKEEKICDLDFTQKKAK